MNLYDVFAETVRRQPAHLAIVGSRDNVSMTYSELDGVIGQAAAVLQRAGVGKGNCVGLNCSSGAEYIILTYAVWKCGGCVVPIPTELTATEKREICREISLGNLLSDKRK